jgi:hypothetical protein|tara:strand:+ start:262 stop:399 length:138 start_codon:yes stop_codon:yes gene_type:complete
MMNTRKKATVKKVIRDLNKASRSHAGQAKKLKKVIGTTNGKKRKR